MREPRRWVSSHYFASRLRKDDASFRRRGSMSGRYAKTESSRIASRARISSLSLSQACGSSHVSVARISYRPQIIVGEANPLVGRVHERMPVMLMSEDYDRWLNPATGVDDLKSMLKPYDPALMQAYAVSRAVNSVKNDTEECIEPVAG
jgi:hypothetical protein